MKVNDRKFATKKKLINLLNKFEKATIDFADMGSQPPEFHDEIKSNYEQSKTILLEFIDVVYSK